MLLPSHVRSYDTSRMTQAMIMPCHARSYKTQIVLWSCCLVWSSKSSGMTQPTMLPSHFWSYKVVLQTLQYWIGEKMYVKRTSGIFSPSYRHATKKQGQNVMEGWKNCFGSQAMLSSLMLEIPFHSVCSWVCSCNRWNFQWGRHRNNKTDGHGDFHILLLAHVTGQECKECQYQDVQETTKRSDVDAQCLVADLIRVESWVVLSFSGTNLFF